MTKEYVVLDTPTTGQIVDGQLCISGWAVRGDGASVDVLCKLDGKEISTPILRIHRPDVHQLYPHLVRPQDRPGFVGWVSMFGLADGGHTLDICILGEQGKTVSPQLSCTFTVHTSHWHYQQLLADAASTGSVLHRSDIYGSGPPNTQPNQEVLNLILHYARAPLLDLGCGIGAYVQALQANGVTATGIEVNPEHVTRANQLGRDATLYDGQIIPFADNSFDTAIAIEVLEHVPHWDSILAEMLRVARRMVLISVPNIGGIPPMSRDVVVPWHILEGTHVNFFTPEIMAHRLSQIPDIAFTVFTYGSIPINQRIFHNHIFAVISRDLAMPILPFQAHGAASTTPRARLRDAIRRFSVRGSLRSLYAKSPLSKGATSAR